jgi:hypothetical protein
MGLLIGLKDNKIYPEFWQSYLSCFDSKLKENTEKRVVVLIRKQQAWIFEQM